MLNRAHRFRLPILLFSAVLSAALFLTPGVGSSQTIAPPNPSTPIAQPDVAQRLTKPTAKPPVAPVSLTQDVRKTVLDNGLTILTKEVHTAPVVTVQVWYKVGSRNEAAGINGISHQLEHLMFKGTAARPIQFGRLFSALGSSSNAFTSYDQTAYFGTVRRDKLGALLELEADRMRNSIIDAQQLDSEKRVVISELQGYENSPNYRLGRVVQKAAFPQHPYGLPIGGTKADVAKFTVDQVKEYYQTFYHPDNATVILVGDFQTEAVLQQVKQAFGQIPGRSPAERQAAMREQPKIDPTKLERREAAAPIVLQQPGSASFMQAIYPLPSSTHPDVPALQVMDLVLTEGRNSRLYQSLIESGIASGAGGYPATLAAGGWYTLTATAVTGQPLEKVDQVMQQTIAQIQEKGVTAEELQRAKAQVLASVVLENRDITNQAFQLGYDETTAGDYRYTDRILAAINQVTAADVQRVAQVYLKPTRRTVGYFKPTQASGTASATPGNTGVSEKFSPGAPVDPAEVAKYLPPIKAETFDQNQTLPDEVTLPNGLKVLLLPDKSTPTVTLSGFIQAGTEFDTAERAGIASWTAGNLMNGTQTKDALTLAKALEDRGARLQFAANREGVSIGGLSMAQDLPILLQTLSDVVQNAAFPEKELELSRQRALVSLKLELDNPARLGRRVFQQAVYPANHPFHNFPTEESLKRLTRNDVLQFYKTHYRPDTTVLALVGSFDPTTVKQLLNQQLGKWPKAGTAPTVSYPTVGLPTKLMQFNPDMPGKTQSITLLGYQGIDRRDPRYYQALVLNEILGGSTLSSRLGTEIRDRQGLTYGIYSFFAAGRQPGPFLIQMQTAPEDAQRAIAATVKLLEQLRQEGVMVDEVSTAKRSLANSYPVELADPDDLAETILMNQVFGLSQTELRQFPAKIEAITPEQVNQVLQDLIHPDRLVVVTAGPTLAKTPQK